MHRQRIIVSDTNIYTHAHTAVAQTGDWVTVAQTVAARPVNTNDD